jgi:hypothetical protein
MKHVPRDFHLTGGTAANRQPEKLNETRLIRKPSASESIINFSTAALPK